jgi:hypothetical protein
MTDAEFEEAMKRTLCARCGAIATTRITTQHRGKERLCAACKVVTEAEEAKWIKQRARQRKRSLKKPVKPFSNIERINRMCAAFGLAPMFPATPEPAKKKRKRTA